MQKNNIDAITYFEVIGRGQLERPNSERIIQGYRINETFVRDFVGRNPVELIVEDAKVTETINMINQDGIIKGNIFVSDISESHEF